MNPLRPMGPNIAADILRTSGWFQGDTLSDGSFRCWFRNGYEIWQPLISSSRDYSRLVSEMWAEVKKCS